MDWLAIIFIAITLIYVVFSYKAWNGYWLWFAPKKPGKEKK